MSLPLLCIVLGYTRRLKDSTDAGRLLAGPGKNDVLWIMGIERKEERIVFMERKDGGRGLHEGDKK